MTPGATDWLAWWDTENIITPAIWRRNMQTFVEASAPLLGFGPDDVVLDIGSGPGYLADCLKHRVREIHCVDTSQRYVEMCRAKFANDSNVFVHILDGDNYTDLSPLEPRRFSIVVCQSVIQYYRALAEVEALISAVRRIVMQGARLLIADIPIKTHRLLLTYGLLSGSWRDGGLAETIRLLFRMATSPCGHAYSSLPLLIVSEAELCNLVSGLRLDATILGSRLTCNSGRRHLLVRF